MKGEQGFRSSSESELSQKREVPKDPAELLFDSIMADVRKRKKEGDLAASFKTHERYGQWLNLRNKNIADTPITPEQQRVYDARKTEETKAARGLERIAREQDADEKARDSYEAKRVEKAREAQELEGLTIDRFYKPGKDLGKGADASQAGSLLLGKVHRPLSVSGRLVEGGFKGEAEKTQIAGILTDMTDLKSVYSIQIASLKEMSWLDRLTGKKGSLERQIAETEEAIIAKSEALIKEFKVSGEMFEKQDVIVEQLWELARSLKQAFSVGRAAVGLAVLTAVLAGCGGEFAKKVSAADSFNFKAPITASADSFGDDHSDHEGASVSTRSESSIAGYRVSPEPMSAASELSVDNRELFALTPDEASKVDNFRDWRRAILNPEYVGKLQADGTIPTTEKGFNTAIGTKLAITVNGVEKIKMEVKKGGSIWQVLDKNKDEIRKIAKDNGGFGVLGLQVEPPTDSKDIQKSVASKSESGKDTGVKVKNDKTKAGKGPAKSDVGKGASSPETASNPELDSANQADMAKKLEAMGVKHALGRDYFDLAGYDAAIDELKKLTDDLAIKDTVGREIKRLNSYREALQRRLDLEQVAAKKFLTEKGAKHIVGQDYKTIENYDAAIVELENIGHKLATEIGPIVDMKESDEQLKLAKIQRGLQAEVERLESAKQALRVRQHQEMIDKEGKVPKEAPAKKLDWSKKPAVTDLVLGTDLELRATGAYARNLSKAHEDIRAVAEFLISAKTDNEKNKFLAMAQAAKKVYENILISVGSKNSPNKFTVDQANIGLEISKQQIQDIQDSLPQKDIKSLADSAKYKLDDLRNRSKNRLGNKAIFGADGALETLQMIIENIVATGKISNADKKKLQAVKRTAHTVIHSDNNTKADQDAAKEILDLVNNLNQGVSKKDRELANNLDISAPGERYSLPKAMN